MRDSGAPLTWRARAQIPFDATVRVSLDTNLTMIKENPDDGPSCTVAGRCGFCGTRCCCECRFFKAMSGVGSSCTMASTCSSCASVS